MTHFLIDHAAMVLKYEGAPDEVYYLEANGGDNVSFSTYSNIKSLIGNRI